MLDDLLKNSSAQSSLNEQRNNNNDLADSNWSPFNSLQQASEHHQNPQWSQSQSWPVDGDFSDWSNAKKSQQVPPQPSIKSWAKIVSQQSSPSTNSQTGQQQNQTTNQKGELNQDWDIKVNQTVPWNLDPNNPQHQQQQQQQQLQQQQQQTVVPSSSTSSAASSSSSTSSISSNDKLLNNMIQFKQDTGTEIWLSNNNNNNNSNSNNNNKPMWEQQKETEVQNWSPNQQAPQWNAAPATTGQGWNESWADQSLAQQQMMAKIEPTGWEDPDFKQTKKSDDGTNIWGDPEQAKQAKIQKWSFYTKHTPNPATIKPNESDFANSQWSKGSSWNNTPAAPINQSIINDVPNELKMNSQNSEWNSDLVDTKSWIKDTKSEHEWDTGRVDTSSWGMNLPAVSFFYVSFLLFFFLVSKC